MTPIERDLLNNLQGGFPVCAHPFQVLSERLGYSEDVLIESMKQLIAKGYVSRFGPLFNTEKLGGTVTLAAMAVPPDKFDTVARQVNAFEEVAHNYEREDHLNMWFVVLACDKTTLIDVLDRIAHETGLEVLNFPKEQEYFLELKLEVPE
jgi:DNA-binding Lrp family transcriptional regulator